jgi:hypothetical protein
MREKLLIAMSIMINDRLEEINMSHYSWDLSELNDPVINTILELRKIIFIEKVETDCSINFLDYID